MRHGLRNWGWAVVAVSASGAFTYVAATSAVPYSVELVGVVGGILVLLGSLLTLAVHQRRDSSDNVTDGFAKLLLLAGAIPASSSLGAPLVLAIVQRAPDDWGRVLTEVTMGVFVAVAIAANIAYTNHQRLRKNAGGRER